MRVLARPPSRLPVATTTGTVWGVGSRLQWDVTKSFYIGVEAIYQQVDSAQTGLAGNAIDGSAHAGKLRCDDLVEYFELDLHAPHAQGLPALIG